MLYEESVLSYTKTEYSGKQYICWCCMHVYHYTCMIFINDFVSMIYYVHMNVYGKYQESDKSSWAHNLRYNIPD